MCEAFRRTKDGALLFVRVTPNARGTRIEGVRSGAGDEMRLAVKVAAPPDQGRANKAVIDTLAAALGLPKSRFGITSGAKDRLKTVSIAGDGGVIEARLAALIDGLPRGVA